MSERAYLETLSSFSVLEYIRSSIEILANLNLDADDKKTDDSQRYSQNDYEEMLQKLEGETRNHIRIEQQLKLHIDNLQEKIEEMKRNEKDLQAEIKGKASTYMNLENELKVANARCDELKHKIGVLEKALTPFSTNVEQSHSQISISTEEKIGKFHCEISEMKRVGDLAKRVSHLLNYRIVE